MCSWIIESGFVKMSVLSQIYRFNEIPSRVFLEIDKLIRRTLKKNKFHDSPFLILRLLIKKAAVMKTSLYWGKNRPIWLSGTE